MDNAVAAQQGYRCMTLWGAKIMNHAWDLASWKVGHLNTGGGAYSISNLIGSLEFVLYDTDTYTLVVDNSGFPPSDVRLLVDAALIDNFGHLENSLLTVKGTVQGQLRARKNPRGPAPILEQKIETLDILLDLLEPYQYKELTDKHNDMLIKIHEIKKKMSVVK